MKTIMPAQPDETVTELSIEEGAVRLRVHRVVGWAVDADGNAKPIGVGGPLNSAGFRGTFFYRQPNGWVQPLNNADDDVYDSIETAVEVLAQLEGVTMASDSGGLPLWHRKPVSRWGLRAD